MSYVVNFLMKKKFLFCFMHLVDKHCLRNILRKLPCVSRGIDGVVGIWRFLAGD